MEKCEVVTIIVNWNLQEDLGGCIDSLKDPEGPNQEILIVDNASTDGSLEFIRKKYPDIHVIALKKNIGYAGGLNVGIRYALSRQAEYVFIANNDTVTPPGTLKELVNVMQKERKIGLLTPKVLYYSNPKLIYSLGAKSYRYLPIPLEFGHKRPDRANYRGIMDYDYVTGCAMLIRSSIFQSIGLFDESYFMYYEDGDFCRRIRNQGFRIACDGDVVLYHKASLSSKKQGVNIIYMRARNKAFFYRRYPHGPFRWFTFLTLWLMTVWYIFIRLITGRSKEIKPYFTGFLHGWLDPLPSSKGIYLEEWPNLPINEKR